MLLRRIALAGVLPGVAALGFVGVGTASAAPAPNVNVCHFAGNTAPAPWTATHTLLTGDYVVNHTANGLQGYQVSYCLAHGGIGVISVNANSLTPGHGGVQLLTRVAAYGSAPGRS